MTTRPVPANIDVDEARRLLDALERDLHDLRSRQAPSAELDVLMAEVSQLREVLQAGDRSDAQMHSELHGMRERLHRLSDELVGDAFQAGRYLSELGRILGLG
jgi:hypothetical protein